MLEQGVLYFRCIPLLDSFLSCRSAPTRLVPLLEHSSTTWALLAMNWRRALMKESVSRDPTTAKGYGVIFTCLATRCATLIDSVLLMWTKLHHSYWLEWAIKYVQSDYLCAHLLVTLIEWKGLLNSSILSCQPSNSRTALCIKVEWPSGTSEKLGAFTQHIKHATRYTLNVCVKTLKYINMHTEATETKERLEQPESLQVVTVTQLQSPTVTSELRTAVCLPTDARLLPSGGHSPTQVCGKASVQVFTSTAKKNARVQSPETHLSGLPARMAIWKSPLW